MIAALRAIWAEILTPSLPSERPYEVLLIAIGHAVLGAALTGLSGELGLVIAAARLLVPIVYWLVKERADLLRGGSVTDGLIDAWFVALGTLYGPAIWPAYILGTALLFSVLKATFDKEPS